MVVAIVVALIITQLLSSVMSELATKLAGIESVRNISSDWKSTYLQPVFYAALQLLLLEVLTWIYIWVHDALSTKK